MAALRTNAPWQLDSSLLLDMIRLDIARLPTRSARGFLILARRVRPAVLLSRFGEVEAEHARLAITLALMAACALGGGGARSDIASLLYLRPFAALTLTAFLVLPGEWDFSGLRTLFILLGALAVSIALQLIPIPYNWWLAMPGHRPFGEGDKLAELQRSWRAVTLTPDLTLNSLLSLLPPLAMLVSFASLRKKQRRFLLLPLLLLILVSAAMGVLQIAGGQNSPAYLYAITNRDSPTGLLANRNHEALLLSMGLPLLRLWALLPTPNKRVETARQIMAGSLALFFFVMIIITGSRAGLGLGIAGLLCAAVMTPISFEIRTVSRRRWLLAGVAAVPGLLIAITVIAGRAVAIQRLFGAQLDQEARVKVFPVVWQITADFMPWGSGFGSFDEVFRLYEPDSLLGPFYFNHAHNDLLELVQTGGLPALSVLIGFLAWATWRALSAFRPWRDQATATLFQRAAAMVIGMALAASLVDYPLRTPLIGVIFAIACCWLGSGGTGRSGTQGARPAA